MNKFVFNYYMVLRLIICKKNGFICVWLPFIVPVIKYSLTAIIRISGYSQS